jgi:hypothetical protein
MLLALKDRLSAETPFPNSQTWMLMCLILRLHGEVAQRLAVRMSLCNVGMEWFRVLKQLFTPCHGRGCEALPLRFGHVAVGDMFTIVFA